MNDIVASVDAPQRGGAGESKSEQVPSRLSGKHKPRVLIVGGGFEGGDADVTLIDRHNHHPFQPLLHQVATDLLAASEVATPIDDCAPATFGYQLPYAPRNLCRNVIREVNACCSRTSVTCQRLGPSRI
jgi:hypothetical protein